MLVHGHLPALLALAALLSGCAPRSAPPSAATPPEAAPAAAPQRAALSGTLVVGVPCGLAMGYKQVRTLFQQANPEVKFVEHINNVGPMVREIRDGKVHMDVFLSLGEEEIAILTRDGKVQGQPTPFLRQSMQLIVQKGNPLGIKRLEDLARPEVKTVALCVPERTLGVASEKAMRAAGVWDKLAESGRIIRLDQPMQTKEFVFAHKADAAFIYAACSSEQFQAADPARTVVGKAEVVMDVPEDSYGGMFAVAAIPAGAPSPDLAAKFIQFMLTAPAQEAMAKIGYGKMNAAQQTLSVGVPCGLAMVHKEARTMFLQENPEVKFVDRIEDIRPLVGALRDGTLKLDVLISFGETEVAPLRAAGKLDGAAVPFMRRDMELCVRKGNPLGIKGLKDLARPQVHKVAICTDGLTVGAAAVRALKSAGVWQPLSQNGRLLRLDQPLKLKQAVLSGKADAALIYAAGNACSIENPERCVAGKAELMTIPEETYGGMATIAVSLTTAPNPELARRFVQFMVSPKMQAAVAKSGFSPVKPPPPASAPVAASPGTHH